MIIIILRKLRMEKNETNLRTQSHKRNSRVESARFRIRVMIRISFLRMMAIIIYK